MPVKHDDPVDKVIAELEEVIPRAMEHRRWLQLMKGQPQLAQKPLWSQPPERCPGLSLALIRDAECVWTKGYRVKSTKNNEPITTDTVFLAWSCTKAISAYAALKMCERGILELDRPLYEYLPEPFISNDPRATQVTTRMALSHTSGLSNNGMDPKFNFDPGVRFAYSGGGFAYLQKAIEHLTGVPFSQYIRKIF